MVTGAERCVYARPPEGKLHLIRHVFDLSISQGKAADVR